MSTTTGSYLLANGKNTANKIDQEKRTAASRLDEVKLAIAHNDWDRLRALSVLPGGFGVDGRKLAWPYLLHAKDDFVVSPSLYQPQQTPNQVTKPKEKRRTKNVIPSDPDELKPPASLDTSPDLSDDDKDLITKPHPDERQVALDTDRSFVNYPTGEVLSQKNLRKAQLHSLIIAVLRKRQKLSYFQGFHDIVSILYLTLHDGDSTSVAPSPLLVSCTEKISLHRLRDSMGTGLEPLMGFLRIMKRIIRAADPDLAKIVESSSPLPYFALSNLLTLLSHDIPTLPLIQRIFDFLLSRPPIYVIYLSAALLLSRKADIQRLKAEDDEEGMMHSVLGKLPELIADGEDGCEVSRNKMTVSSLSQPLRGLDMKPTPQDTPLNISPQPLGDPPAYSPTDEAGNNKKASQSDVHATRPHDEKSLHPAPLDHSSQPSPSAIPISFIFQQTIDLYNKYPPEHSSINVNEIMGPNSVVNTWAQTNRAQAHLKVEQEGKTLAVTLPSRTLPADDDAENIVLDPSLIVYPYDPAQEYGLESDEVDVAPVIPPKRVKKKNYQVTMDRLSILAGGVVVIVGVGVAIYSTSQSGGGGGISYDQVLEWQSIITGWMGGAVLGV